MLLNFNFKFTIMEMKENIKIGLLGIIALVLIYGVFLKDSNNGVSKSTVAKQTKMLNNNTQQINNTALATPSQPQQPTGPTTGIQFAEMEYNFGDVNQDSENKHNFTFTNTGNEPLIISNARGSCGCTVPKYPKEPIPDRKSVV